MNTKKKETRGRKPLPAAKLRIVEVKIRLTEGERKRYVRKAGGQPLATWLRELAEAASGP